MIFLRRLYPLLAFLGGFVWDALTIGQQVRPMHFWRLGAFLCGAAVLALWLAWREVRQRVAPPAGNGLRGNIHGLVWQAPYLLMQFFFGGIFSALFILYFKSSAYLGTWLTTIFLGVLLVGNELACLAHCRRKFFDLHAAGGHPVAEEALRRIGALYAVEARARDGDVTARLTLRQQEAVPRLKEWHDWLIAQRIKTADGSGLARAIDYSLKRWPALIRYGESGSLPIDNNMVENAIRPITLGRRNWLFTGSERAGYRAAAIQSLLATAKLNELDPYAWLKDTLEKIPTWPYSRIDELLPLRTVVAENLACNTAA